LNTKRKILFVDDEPNILQGLQRMLRAMRTEWEMAFALNGEDALAELERSSYDIIVTDWRMPRMNGAQLLEQVKQHHPGVIRIMLSGQSDELNLLNSIGPSHQYLSKPCDYETLKSTLDKACRLRDLLSNTPIQRLVTNLTSIPSVPTLYFELLDLLEQPDTSVKDVANLMSKDLGMTARLIQLANSAYFGASRHVSSPVQAVSLIGLTSVKALLLTTHVFSHFNTNDSTGFRLDTLWQHSLSVGQKAKSICSAMNMSAKMSDYSYTASLLHDAGVLLLIANLPDDYGPLFQNSVLPDIPLANAERAVFGTTHAEVGAYLLGLWGLPDEIVDAVAYHHKPNEHPLKGITPLALVHVADAFDSDIRAGSFSRPTFGLNMEYIAEIGIADHIPAWQILCNDQDQKGVRS